MKAWLSTVMLVLSFLFAASPCYSEIYKWVDENGVTTFRDTPPPKGVEAEVLNPMDTRLGDGDVRATGSRPDHGARKATRQPKVEVYMTEWCPSCKSAIKYLNSIGVRYRKYDIDKDARANKRLHNRYGQSSIPFTIIGDRRILGFSKSRFDAALGL